MRVYSEMITSQLVSWLIVTMISNINAVCMVKGIFLRIGLLFVGSLTIDFRALCL